MSVTGKRSWYIAAVILGREFVYRKLEWDDEVAAGLAAAEGHFWKEYVQKGIMPPPDGSEACDRVLAEYFRVSGKTGAVRLVGFDEKLGRREEILKAVRELETEQRMIEQEIKMFMKDSEYASSEKYRVSWSRVDTARLDTKRIREEHPEIYGEYAKVSSSRRFQVRAA